MRLARLVLLRSLLTASLLAPSIAAAVGMQSSQASDLESVLGRSRQRLQKADIRAVGHLVRVDASGARTIYAITLKAHWFPGVLRVLCQITSPSDARAHILLEMHPNGQDVIQIAHPGDAVPVTLPYSKWSDGPLGPGFSYEDFFESQYFWPGQTVTPNTKFGSRICDLLKSTPVTNDRSHYAEVETWLDHTIGYPVYVEKTLKGTSAVKQFTYFGLRQISGVWSASQIEEKTRGQAGSSLLIFDRGSAKANLNLGEFSPEQLTKF